MITTLCGRRARGFYQARNPKYNETQPTTRVDDYLIDVAVEGEIVAVYNHNFEIRLWVITPECRLRRIDPDTAVILPRDHVGDLR